MELAIALLFCAVLGVPFAVFILYRRVSALDHRMSALDGEIAVLRRQLKQATSTTAQPVAPSPAARALLETPSVVVPGLHSVADATVEALPPFVANPPLMRPERPGPLPMSVPAPVRPPSVEAQRPEPQAIGRNWEQFLGAKLFAWVGGLALFMGVAFFIKYSFEHNLVPPWLRIAGGFAVGLGLLASGVFIRNREYKTLTQTLVATGIVILYAVSFAARSAYGLIGGPALFVLLLSITTTALTLAIRMDAQVVAVLGLLGGFLTPFLLGGKSETPFALFSYILFLNLGLLALAHYRRWRFLVLLGSVASVLTANAWYFNSLRPDNSLGTLVMTMLVCVEYIASFYWSPDENNERPYSHWGAIAQGLSAFLLGFHFLHLNLYDHRTAGAIFLGDCSILALLWRGRRNLILPISLSGTTALLACWISFSGSAAPVYLQLGSVVLMCVLNGVLPLWVGAPVGGGGLWPGAASLAGVVTLFLSLNITGAQVWLFWPAVLLIDGVLLAASFIQRNRWLALAGTVLTFFLTANWIVRLDRLESGIEAVVIIAAFGLLFYGAAAWLCLRCEGSADRTIQSIVVPAVLPFFLAASLIVKLPELRAVQIFGFALIMDLVLLGSATLLRKPEATLAALVGTLLVEYVWMVQRSTADVAGVSLGWYAGFSLLFTLFPFIARKAREDNLLSWRASASAGPLHFALVYQTFRLLWPGFLVNGLIPALFCLPAGFCLLQSRKENAAATERQSQLTALYGASLLFFVTLIFPIQFSREWLTLGWALEGAGLFWLYLRAPVRWLVQAGFGLLCVAFARLVFNPLVLQYHARNGLPLWNWYLYSYGIVAAALFTAAQLVSPLETILGSKLRPILATFGTITVFVLLNIEIADYFATGSFVTFEFSGNFARDMTYSLAWSLFALGLLLVGVIRLQKGTRYAGIGLMLVTIVKLFFHDLGRLDQRYRIGAFIGVAVILMVASFIYQRFLSQTKPVAHRGEADAGDKKATV